MKYVFIEKHQAEFIDRNLNPKKIKKHPKTDVYSTLPACHECTAVN
ncbi:hypothetical protein BvCmsKSP076_03829 [Escherichia coli]|nr:hypothetical protein BvCmsKSP076_03829 [Escherichia coli]